MKRIVEINNDAYEDFSTGMNMLDAMGKLRHALQLCSQHIGWWHPETAFALRNLVTGNLDNDRESLALVRFIALSCDQDTLDPGTWDSESAEFLKTLASFCEKMHDEDLARRFEALAGTIP